MRAFAALAAVLLLTACGVRPSDVILGGPAPTAVTGAPAPTAAVVQELPVFLVFGGRVTPVPRSAAGLAVLAAGPTAAERAEGYTSEVPPGVVFETAGSTVTVSTDVTSLSPNAVDQIVCTAAQGPVTLVGGGRSLGPLVCRS